MIGPLRRQVLTGLESWFTLPTQPGSPPLAVPRPRPAAMSSAGPRPRRFPLQGLPELDTVDGVADLGFALAAWFVDPHRNWIGLLQLKKWPGQVTAPATSKPLLRRAIGPGA